jgi:hypothetical protein
MLAFLENIPIIGPIFTNIKWLLISAAVVIVTSGITGGIMYVKGYNAAAAKCKLTTIIRERDELKRDRDVQKSTSEYYRAEAARLSALQAAREQKDAEDAVNVKPIEGCVVPEIVPAPRPKPKRGWLRGNGTK